LRDQWQLLAIGGQGLDDVIKQEHVIKLVQKQKDLNFAPGSRYLYCNTGYTLLAEIVKKVSGKSLREYADENIFKPLGMEHTHFHDDNTEIVKDRTYSYTSTDKGKFANSPLNYAIVGATSLFTTVEDEARWLDNYETGKAGGPEAVSQMYEQGILNSGKKLNYAFAIVVDSVSGYQRIGHGGADAGYRTYAVRYPEEKLGIVVFSNLAQFNPNDLATKVAKLYLPGREQMKKETVKSKADSSLFRLYSGSYCSPETGLQIVDSTKLYLKIWAQSFALDPVSDTSFSLFDGYATLIFAKSNEPSDHFLFVTNGDEVVFTRAEKPVFTKAALAEYPGIYVSDELDAQYEIALDNDQLVLKHRKYPDVNIQAITANQFSTPHWWMSNIIFRRDPKGKISGFEVNCDRVLHLAFQKKPASAI
jgi:CubicO group peptidase (beta-lactamase class C family)